MKSKTKPKVLSQGAEAIILLENNKVIKKRVPKSYRIEILDNKIRKLRTRAETKLLSKAYQLISVPEIINSSEAEYSIEMEYIKGLRLSENLRKFSIAKQKKICSQIGSAIARLHDSEIIHGDLTTSNMILGSRKSGVKGRESKVEVRQPNSDNLFFIDFGLGFISRKFEDKAVDLHLLRQALEAKHYENWEILFEEVLRTYSEESKDSGSVLERLKAVERRGRYKH